MLIDDDDNDDEIDFEATFDKKSRAHFLHKAERNCRLFKFIDINTVEYWSEMTRILVKRFDMRPEELTPADYSTFVDNLPRHGGVKRRDAKPIIDCWLLVAGKVREGFDVRGYLLMFPWVENDLKAIRRHLTIIEERKLI